MDSITTAVITGLIGMTIGLIGKIIWDWLKIRRNNTNGAYGYNNGYKVLYQVQQDLALMGKTVDTIATNQVSPEMKRLLEENHEMFNDRHDIKIALEKQNAISVETNVLLRDLRDELSKTTAQFAAVAKGLAEALQRIKEK